MSGGALSAAGALAWLGSLSIDLRATAVLDAGGACLAGDAELARRAAAVLAARAAAGGTAAVDEAGGGATGPGRAAADALLEAREGDLLAVRSARHAVVAALGPRALEGLARADLRAALEALDRA